MNSRVVVALEGVLLAGAAAFLIFQVAGVWPSVATMFAARSLHKARASGDRKATEKTLRSLLRRRPRDGGLRLLLSRTILSGGDYRKAGDAYAEAAKRSAAPGRRAAAEVGRGVSLLLKSTPPSPEDLAAALGAFEKGAETRAVSGDARALKAVAHIWAGDLDAARAAAEGVKKGLGLEPSAALACVRAYLAGAADDPAAALQELQRARMLAPGDDSPVGKYVSGAMKAYELEAAARPGAPAPLRAKLVKHLQAEGPKGIVDEKSYPLFFRAAFSCALSADPAETKVGMHLLSRAAAGRPKDPTPLVATAAAFAHAAAPLWKKAEEEAKAAAARGGGAVDAGPSVIDFLPGGGPAKPKTTRASRALVEIDKIGARIGESLAKAAALYAAGAPDGGADNAEGAAGTPGSALGRTEGAARAVGLYEHLFTWHLRASELSAQDAARRTRELRAAAQAVAMNDLLGERAPHNEAAARLLRNAGAIYARHCDWEKTDACFTKSLELFGEQPNLKPYAESMRKPPRVVAVHPSTPGELQAGPPLAGVEIALPEAVGSLQDCKVEASVGAGSGERKAITPVISGTGLWYVPKEDELPDGLVEVRFAVTDPSDRKIEAKVSFRVDSAPPEITSRFPGPDAIVSDRHTAIRIGWRDPSGIDPGSVQVVLEPVRASFVRRLLVDKGLQKSGRFTGAETWKSKTPVVRAGGAAEGTIVTGTMSDLPPGVFRVKVRMRDSMNKLREDAWKFTVR
ncbi:MAG: hypothetical protein ACYTKD_17000 [Planctomycetota bacterium]